MAKQDPLRPRRPTYRDFTQRPANCLLVLAPMLAFYHVGTMFWKTDLLAPHDIHQVLKYFGATAAYLPALVLVTLLVVQQMFRREPWRPQFGVVAGMWVESILEAGPLILLGHLAGKLMVNAAGADAVAPLGPQIVTDLGAAVYEEFIFRMLLVGIVALIFIDMLDLDKEIVLTVAVLVSAALFSLYHFPLEQIMGRSTFPIRDFIFRALAGAYLGILYITRGLGIAAGVHAAFNVYVTLSSSWGQQGGGS